MKRILLEEERWAAEVSRYLHLNPIRVRALRLDKAGRAQQQLDLLRSYPWSSCWAHAGRGPKLACGRHLAQTLITADWKVTAGNARI